MLLSEIQWALNPRWQREAFPFAHLQNGRTEGGSAAEAAQTAVGPQGFFHSQKKIYSIYNIEFHSFFLGEPEQSLFTCVHQLSTAEAKLWRLNK